MALKEKSFKMHRISNDIKGEFDFSMIDDSKDSLEILCSSYTDKDFKVSFPSYIAFTCFQELDYMNHPSSCIMVAVAQGYMSVERESF